MQVWQLMEQLSKCPAGANVNVGITSTLNVPADSFDCDDNEVSIRSSSDVEVCDDNGDTQRLSSLTSTE